MACDLTYTGDRLGAYRQPPFYLTLHTLRHYQHLLHPGAPTFVKFTLAFGPSDVKAHFQNSTLYPLHYDFAAKYLEAFLGLSNAAIDKKLSESRNPRYVTGRVVFRPCGPYPASFDISVPSEPDVETIQRTHGALRDVAPFMSNQLVFACEPTHCAWIQGALAAAGIEAISIAEAWYN